MKNYLKLVFVMLLGIFLGTGCSAQNAGGYENIDAAIFTQKMQKANVVILDVRTPGEFAEGHIENAINIDVNSAEFEAKISELDKSKTYLVYCRSGKRSSNAASQMIGKGFNLVFNLNGGISAWDGKVVK